MRKFFLFVITAVLVSCIKDDAVSIPVSDAAEREAVLCRIGIASKAGSGNYTDSTFRVQLFYCDIDTSARMDSMFAPYAGTYCCPKDGNGWLTPCAVDADGAYDSSVAEPEGAQYGLRAGSHHQYYMVISSPAVPYFTYATVTKKEKYRVTKHQFARHGVQYFRTGQAKDHPSFSEPLQISTSGMAVNGEYLFDFGSVGELVEHRSRLAFSFRCGDAISHTRLGSLSISGMRRTAVFDPMTGEFVFSGLDADCEADTVWVASDPLGLYMARDGSEGAWTEGESYSLTGPNTAVHLADTRTNSHYTYLLSGDYQTIGPGDMYVNEPPLMHITLLSDLGDCISIDPIPLSFVYEAQHSYYYLVTVNSVYLSVSVVSRSWDSVTGLDSVVDSPETVLEYVCPFSVNVSDWDANGSTPGSGGQGVDVTVGGWDDGGGGAPEIG